LQNESVPNLLIRDLPADVHAVLVRRAYELRDNVSAYDAMYLALAEALDCPLITADARLAAPPRAKCAVEVLAD
jgi:hypothetical protein